MRIRSFQTLIGGCSVACTATAQLLDPIKNYCFRFDHQSAVKDGILHIYMGSETFADSRDQNGSANGTITVGYNEYVINVDLNTSWESQANVSEIAFNITADPNTGSLPPQVVRGTMYQGTNSDDSIYLYGGTTSYANASFPGWQSPTPSTYSLWSYDPESTQWTPFNVGQNAPYRPSNGAAAEAVDQGLAFYFNGELESGSSYDINFIKGTYVFVSGMVVINTTDQTARNLSTAQVSADLARARGRMQYIPGVGEKGILVLIGGSSSLANQPNNTDTVNLLPMTEINVLDVASVYNTSTPDGVWYKQNATNPNVTDVPSPRVDFCLVVASAQDSSSHNIYMYGGRDGDNPPNHFDEIWILSLPSFTWIKIYSGTNPRFAHTCHLVGNRTMLTVGGVVDPREMQGLIPNCDFEFSGVAVYDMSDLVWGNGYNATTPAYDVPDPVISAIGGSRIGGATMKMPPSNFSQNGLARIFGFDPDDTTETPSDTTHQRTAETPSNTIHQRIAIIAGTVCGVVGLAILVALGAYAARWWRKKRTHPEELVYEKDVYSDVHGRVVEQVELQSNSMSEQPRQDRLL